MTYDFKITLESVGDGITFVPSVKSFENYVRFVPSNIAFTSFSQLSQTFKMMVDINLPLGNYSIHWTK